MRLQITLDIHASTRAGLIKDAGPNWSGWGAEESGRC